MAHHGHPDFMVCIATLCTEHKHKRHPGQGHCSGCLNDQNEGYGEEHWTFLSNSTEDDRCCCRDNRVGRWPLRG